MTRLEQVQEILKKDKVSLIKIAAEFMELETLKYMSSLKKPTINLYDLPEPYRSDALNSIEKAEKQLEQK